MQQGSGAAYSKGLWRAAGEGEKRKPAIRTVSRLLHINYETIYYLIKVTVPWTRYSDTEPARVEVMT